MSKRQSLISFILLLVVLLAPNSAFAAPGAFESRASALAETLGQLFALVAEFLTPLGDRVAGRCAGDPSACPAPANDIGHGWDPWVTEAPTDEPPNESDIGPLWDPWG